MGALNRLTGCGLGALLTCAPSVAVASSAAEAAPAESAVNARHDPPVIALIIDDLGYSPELARRTLALPRPFAVAILPESPLADIVHESADLHDIDIMLHMPMAASPGQNDYDVAIDRSMDVGEIRLQMEHALALVPDAIAVNNHEGSVTTEDGPTMEAVMVSLAEAGDIAFIDSRTSARSVAEQAALDAGLRTARRHVFLDHDPSVEAVDRAVDTWLEFAERHGCALAIGHPRAETLEVLEQRLARIGEDFDRVGVATYLERCGRER